MAKPVIRVWRWYDDFAFIWNGKEMFYRHVGWSSKSGKFDEWYGKMESAWPVERLESHGNAVELFGAEKYAEIEKFVINGSV